METLNLTTLRQNIFQLADKVLETGEPIVIERNGRRLILGPAPQPALRRLRLDQLPRRKLIVGDPDDLVNAPTWDEASWLENSKLL